MKKIIFFLTTLFTLSLLGQTNVYHPFPDSVTVWQTNCSGYPGNCCCGSNGVGEFCIFNEYDSDFLNGDTIIGSYTYKKLYRSYNRVDYQDGPSYCPVQCNGNYNWVSHPAQYVGAIRQVASLKRIYIKPLSGNDTVLYDFNLNLGDTLKASALTPAHYNMVSTVDSVLVSNQYHKRFGIKSIPSSSTAQPYVYLIEGIGSTYGLLSGLYPAFETNCTLGCVFVDTTSIYPNQSTCVLTTANIKKVTITNQTNIYPNPSTGNFVIETNVTTKQTMQLIDVTGRVILSQTIHGKASIDASTLPNGIYNVNITSVDGVVNKRIVIAK